MKMKRNLIYIMTALLSMVLASCAQEEMHVPGELDSESCYGVYFPTQSGLGDLQIEPDDPTTLKFIVRRTNPRGQIHVPVTIKSNYPIFTADEVVFEDGSPVSEVTVHFPSAKIAVTYDCTLMIEGDEFVSKYSANPAHISFSVTRVKWNDVIGPGGETTGRWRDGIFPEWFAVTYPNLERSIVLQERDDMPGFYRTYDVYNADYLGSMFGANVSSLCVSQHYTYIDATDPDKVWIPTFKTGVIMHSDYGMMSVASYVVENSDDFDPSIASVYGTLKEGVIEFPYGSLQMKLERLGWYQTNSSGLHRIILPGYRVKEYDLTVEAGVSDGQGNLPVAVSLGTDISQVKLAVFEGTLTESAAAEKAELIANGATDQVGEIKTINQTTTLDYSFDKTGMYTVVAAGLDIAGNHRTTKSASFGYLKAGDDANGKVIVDSFHADGVDTANLKIEAGNSSGGAFIAVDEEGERVIYSLGGNTLYETWSEIDPASFEGVQGLYIGETFDEVGVEAAKLAHQNGATVFFGPGGIMCSYGLEYLGVVLEHTDYLLVNLPEAKMLSGCDTKEAAIKKLLEAGAKNLILTEGKHGSGCYNKDGFITAPAFPVEAVDTTGAGDTFTAGLLHAMTEGFEIQQALRFAAACAAEAVKVVGARTSMPTAEKMAAVWPALNGSDPE